MPGEQLAYAMGSPVHAGIDLGVLACPASGTWFPRTRGDRPLDKVKGQKPELVPPYTRG